MKKVLRTQYADVAIYWTGLAIGIVWSDGELYIIIPFVQITVKTWMFRKPSNQL